jgi:hypothetical protein
LKKTGCFKFTLFLLAAMQTAIWGQSIIVNPDSALSDSTAAIPAVLRSVFVPGWGQIYQDRLLEGVMLYGSSAYYYYNAFFQLYHYRKGYAQHHLVKFRSNLQMALFLHLINLVDIVDTSFRVKPSGWQGGLLQDKPLKSPWGAALRSAILPGWGQLYTESYWKAAGYIAVDGYLFYKIREADIRYRGSRETKYRDDRSRYSWYFGLAYMITIADAYADAYLYRFNDAMRLTVIPDLNPESVGLAVQVRF